MLELFLTLLACVLIAVAAVAVARRSKFAGALGAVAIAFPLALAADWGCVAATAFAQATGYEIMACDLEQVFSLNDSFVGLGIFLALMLAEAGTVVVWARFLSYRTPAFAYPAIGVLVNAWSKQWAQHARLRKARRNVRREVRRNASGVIVNFAERGS